MAPHIPRFSHLGALLTFAALASVALGCLARRTTAGRVKHAAWSFFLFIAIGIGIAWLMYPLSR
jgi:hypothetical protein